MIHERSVDVWLRLIATFKMVKATLLAGAAGAAAGLLYPRMAKPMTRWAMDLAADQRYRVLDTVIGRVVSIEPHTLRLVSFGSLLYAILFYVEGVGLYFERRWAQYMTIITTAGLIPFEVLEIHRWATPTKTAVLISNLLIVAYLARRVVSKSDPPLAATTSARKGTSAGASP